MRSLHWMRQSTPAVERERKQNDLLIERRNKRKLSVGWCTVRSRTKEFVWDVVQKCKQ